MITRVFAADPGERTGWCIAEVDFNLFDPKTGRGFGIVAQGVKDYHEMQDWAVSRIVDASDYPGDIDVLVYETWRLYADKALTLVGNDMQSSQVVGILRLVGRAAARKVVSQSASLKQVADRTMPTAVKERMAKSSEIHDQDAIRHAWHYAYSRWAKGLSD